MVTTQRDNLFAIDFEAVLNAIADANTALAQRHSDLMAALDRAPATLVHDGDIAKAKSFAAMLKTHLARCRSTRLADTKPLRDLVRQVNQFFKTMEEETKDAQEIIAQALCEAASSEGPSSHDGAIVINAQSGAVLANTASGPATSDAPGIELEWDVSAVSVADLDLEALRPYLTERTLITAARKHLREHGSTNLKGATYRQKAVI